ncbi:MAG: RRXRR domain-containing protein, partial [Cetobacterium sp.]
RVPVQNPDGTPAMPTKPSRARRMVRDGLAIAKWSDLGVYYIQLVAEPSDRKTQKIVIGVDPGKLFSGIAVQSAKVTLFLAHLCLPFKSVTKKMTGRRILRRARRGRRINRNIAFTLRAHRQKRFSNRRQTKLPPSIRANRELELRVVKELLRLFPIATIVYEYIEARGSKSFSPVMVGQKLMLSWLSKLAPVVTKFGWETSNTRKHLGLIKNKADKSIQSPETHAVDGIALAATQFVSYEPFHSEKQHGHSWAGTVEITPAPFKVVSRPNLYRRQLHFENPLKGGERKRKGGTVTPFGYRSGDKVQVKTKGQILMGWVGGYTDTNKSKKVSVYDLNWHRIGQFGLNQINLIRRSTNLCIA